MSNSIKYILLIFMCLLFTKTDAIALSFADFTEKTEITYQHLPEQTSEESNNQQPEEESENERPIEDDFVGILPSFYQMKIHNDSFYLTHQTNVIIAHISLPHPPPDCR